MESGSVAPSARNPAAGMAEQDGKMTSGHELANLAREHHAWVASDGPGFRRRARILQSMWREEQGYEPGLHRGKPLGSRLRMPWAEDTLANYLTDAIREVVRAEVLNPEKSEGKLYARPRIFNDLLSSQPICFNLFGELQQDLTLAAQAFAALAPSRVAKVTGIEFEHSPGRGDPRYTGDSSAFDVYVTFDTPQGGRGFIGIEVKYHENLKDVPAKLRPRYDEVADVMSCFRNERRDQLKQSPLQQIWRDHLLAGALRHIGDKDGAFDDGFFAFLYPEGNNACAEAVTRYQECLTDTSTFATWTLESVHGAAKASSDADWLDAFHDRYLDFGKLTPARPDRL